MQPGGGWGRGQGDMLLIWELIIWVLLRSCGAAFPKRDT